MPAIQPARLKIQTAELAESFPVPARFLRSLHDLLGYYSDRAYRPGQTGEPPPLLKAYNVPPPVLREILKALVPSIQQDRSGALDLCRHLWDEPNYEFRHLAISVLGQVFPEPPDDLLVLVEAWANPKTELRLINAIFNTGLGQVRSSFPELYLQRVGRWLVSQELFRQQLGLQALLPLLADLDFDNLPVIFRMLAPLVRSAPLQLRPDLLEIIQQLARRSPKEAAFFLRQNLSVKTDNPGTAWLARKSLDSFPIDIQANLRAALREAR
jgi:hypothetical protein